MKTYTMALKANESSAPDGDFTISFETSRSSPPAYLSDFIGGHGRVNEGYSTHSEEFSIREASWDRSITLVFADRTLKMLPCMEVSRTIVDPKDPNYFHEHKLVKGQAIRLEIPGKAMYELFAITYMSW